MTRAHASKSLDSLCFIEIGRTPSRGIASYWDRERASGHVWVSIADLANTKDSHVSDSREYISDRGAALCRIVRAGTLLVSFKLTLGRLAYAGRDLYTNEAIAALTPRNNKELDKRFLYYFLSYFDWKKATEYDQKLKGRTFSKGKLKQISLSLPHLSEQQRIVGILDEASESIAIAEANAESNTANSYQLFKRILQDTLLNRTRHLSAHRLEALCDDRPITYGVIKLGKEVLDGVPCLRTSNVKWLDIDLTGMKRISATLSAEYRRTILRGGEVLVNVRGTLGGVAVAEDDMAGFNVSREVATVPIDTRRADPQFVAYWIASDRSQDWLSSVKKGAAYTGINLEDLRNLPVPLPAFQEQKEIVRYIRTAMEATHCARRLYQMKADRLVELKQSFLTAAFNGEL